jgi:GNAT superfamily N-acetyltransferase
MIAPQEFIVEQLTEYSEEDVVALNGLSSYLFPHTQVMPVKQELLDAIIRSPDRVLFVARIAGRIVGKGTANLNITELYSRAHLDNFATHEAIRGQGIGSAIWDEFVRWATEKGTYKISLVSDDPDAIEFYERRGAVIRDDHYFNVFFNPKPLAP